mmetsp:Transcript_9190/g.23025  ORF Transcript_9190/g.23025 Transcript_9190/m.23025 type:complete len:598 (-) Transcript_9190:1093-2886(-)|eukprot:CAMPEP_0177653956 /NCGR_PEP_ID=MMETSP0447-20121125/14032_1 /TAXON_ID=0 /ORGANISM="Stygamoeba regulata, Strain BSH-02190019" /LENGTH=597 /DNA_ID=CAMNT_0019157487 /DNA_START=160 /DNA_END=1953 /DNA_ORIENTATION=+
MESSSFSPDAPEQEACLGTEENGSDPHFMVANALAAEGTETDIKPEQMRINEEVVVPTPIMKETIRSPPSQIGEEVVTKPKVVLEKLDDEPVDKMEEESGAQPEGQATVNLASRDPHDIYESAEHGLPDDGLFHVNSVSYCVCSVKGRRPTMEDAHQVVLDLNNSVETPKEELEDLKNESPPKGRGGGRRLGANHAAHEPSPIHSENGGGIARGKYAFFAVYDGHGGRRASTYLAKWAHHILRENPMFNEDPSLALMEALLVSEEKFLKFATEKQLEDGSTAVVGLLVDGRELFIGNIGDSEAVLCRAECPLSITKVHNPQRNPDEIKRITDAGGRLYNKRVGHPHLNSAFFNLAVSRSIGDLMYKHPEFTCGKPSGLIADPDVYRLTLEEDDLFLILACDGLWDVMTHEEVVDFVLDEFARGKSLEDVSKALIKEAEMVRQSADNITLCIVTFRSLKNFERSARRQAVKEEARFLSPSPVDFPVSRLSKSIGQVELKEGRSLLSDSLPAQDAGAAQPKPAVEPPAAAAEPAAAVPAAAARAGEPGVEAGTANENAPQGNAADEGNDCVSEQTPCEESEQSLETASTAPASNSSGSE